MFNRVRVVLAAYLPGTMVCVVIALAATFLSEHYGGPQLLYALLIGLAFHFLMSNPQIKKGVDFCGRTVLRCGVALLVRPSRASTCWQASCTAEQALAVVTDPPATGPGGSWVSPIATITRPGCSPSAREAV